MLRFHFCGRVLSLAALAAGVSVGIAHAEPEVNIQKILDNGAAITVLLEEQNLRFQYSNHWKGKTGLCEQERVTFVDVTSHIEKLDYTFPDKKTIHMDSAFADTTLKFDMYGKNRFLCQWVGASVEAVARRVNFNFDMKVNVPKDDQLPIQVEFQPQQLGIYGLDIREWGPVGDILESKIENMVNHYSEQFFKSWLGKKLAHQVETYINDYLAKQGNGILLRE